MAPRSMSARSMLRFAVWIVAHGSIPLAVGEVDGKEIGVETGLCHHHLKHFGLSDSLDADTAQSGWRRWS